MEKKMNYIYETEGKNRQEAEKKALDILNISPDDVTFEPVNSSSGILGLVSRKPVVLRVFADKKELPIETIIKGVLLTIVKKMDIIADVVATGEMDGNLYIELSSDDSGILIGKHGRTLDALQFLLNLLIDSKLRNGRRIMVDVESYRAKRQQSLTRLAKGVAEKVHRSQQSVLLEYMNPYERRIIHLALETDEHVFTESDGNGVYKRVRIIPRGQAVDINQEFDEDYPEDIGNEAER